MIGEGASPGRRALLLSTDPGIPLYGPSGASAHLRGVARGLDAAVVAVSRSVDGRGAVSDPVEARVVTAPPRGWRAVPPAWREGLGVWDGRRLATRAVAALGPPSLIWERHALFSDAGLWLAHAHRATRIVELNAPLVLERARYGRLRQRALAERLERASLRAADRVVAVSAWLAAWAVAEVGCAPERVRHVPNGTALRGDGDRDGARRRLGLSGLVIGFVGSMKPWHGVERLPAILDALPEATALIVGDGPCSIPAHPRAIALGRVAPADLGGVVAAMDVGLAPYAADAPPWFCPLKILDYQAEGVPVVAADIGDCAALVARGSGEIVLGDAPADWAAAIRRQAHAPRVPRPRPWHDVVREALAP